MGNASQLFIDRKQHLSLKILTDFNNAFQSVMDDYPRTWPDTQKHYSDQKTQFKQQFQIIASELNNICAEAYLDKRRVNPHVIIKKVQLLIQRFNTLPRPERRTPALFNCCFQSPNSFRKLFHDRIIDYYRYLLYMIECTCDDFSEKNISPYEVLGVFDFLTNNTLDQYRKHAMSDRHLKKNFQVRETLIITRDTISAMESIHPEIPNLDNKLGYRPLQK